MVDFEEFFDHHDQFGLVIEGESSFIVAINAKARGFLSTGREDQWIGKPISCLLSSEDNQKLARILKRQVKSYSKITLQINGPSSQSAKFSLTLTKCAKGVVLLGDIDTDANSSIEDRLKLALEASGIGVWEYDLVDQSLVWDQHMYRIYGVSEENFSGAYDAWQQGVHPDDLAQAELDVQNSINYTQDFDSEFRVVWPNGTIRNVKAKARLKFNDDGVPIKMLGVNWDITDSVRQNQALNQAKVKAENANQAKTEFLSNMSHEIRTPMNGILGFLDLLMDSNLNQTQQDYVSIVKRSGNSLLSIINDILDYSKIESGQLSLHPTPTNLIQVFDDLENIFYPLVKSKNLTMNVQCFAERSLTIHIDHLRLNQILTNLVGNAIKFTERGEVNVESYYIEDSETLYVRVADTGVGISEQAKSRIFQPFERDVEPGTSIEGTGLGLSIVKKYIDLMKGSIRCTSAKGKGTTFDLEIHAPVLNASPAEVNQEDNHRIGENISGGLRALLVDDNALNRELAKHRFAKLAIAMDLASSGEEAIALVRKNQYDIVYMDIKMPGIDGYQTAKEIRKIATSQKAQPAIFALTAQAFAEDFAQSKNHLLDGHITKPYTTQDLRKSLLFTKKGRQGEKPGCKTGS